jgi:ABC-type polysaccharide/polyol phosphate export permease
MFFIETYSTCFAGAAHLALCFTHYLSGGADWRTVSRLIFLNPMAGILEAYRSVLLKGEMPDSTLLTAAVISAVIFVFGYWFFKRVEFQFADVV